MLHKALALAVASAAQTNTDLLPRNQCDAREINCLRVPLFRKNDTMRRIRRENENLRKRLSSFQNHTLYSSLKKCLQKIGRLPSLLLKIGWLSSWSMLRDKNQCGLQTLWESPWCCIMCLPNRIGISGTEACLSFRQKIPSSATFENPTVRVGSPLWWKSA